MMELSQVSAHHQLSVELRKFLGAMGTKENTETPPCLLTEVRQVPGHHLVALARPGRNC